MKQFIPLSARLRYQCIKRYWREHVVNQHHFARVRRPTLSHLHGLTHQQVIQISSHFSQKVSNIDRCIEHINGVVVEPGQIFSFWHLVPQPTSKNGFKPSRNLVQGQLKEAIGGGICQVSCILYINALKAGLHILERHAHSVDIYQEHERFTPLGSDATVVYGYKDLQFKNNHTCAVQISLARHEQQLTCTFYTMQPLPDVALSFHTDLVDQLKCVTTYANQIPIASSQYKTPL